jgi:hypothetical protein
MLKPLLNCRMFQLQFTRILFIINSDEWSVMEMANQFAVIKSCSCEALLLGRYFVWADRNRY